MKTNRVIIRWLALAALSTFNLQSSTVFGGPMFPIVTNDTAATGISVACAGTNYLVGIQGDIVSVNNYQITAQLFGPAGTPVGARINPVPGHTGGNPRVASSGTNFLMVWPDDYLNGQHSSVNGQIISSTGALVGGWFAITANSEQKFSSIESVAYGAGRYLVVWDDFSNGSNWAIYGQIISASGALIGGNFLICAPVNGQNEKDASVAFDGTNFLVAWQFNSTSGGYHAVTYGVFISPAGAMGAPFAIGQTVSLDTNPLGLVFNGTNYLVTWNYDSQEDSGGNPFWYLYGRFVTPAGTFPGNEFMILPTNGIPRFPGLAFDGANYLLCWNINYGTTNSTVQCQFLNASGQPTGCQFTPFAAQGGAVPILANLLFDGKQFAAIGTVSAGGTSPTNNSGVYGVFIPASTARPQFVAGTGYTNKQFSLSLTGTPGINYTIQASTNLPASNWMPLITNSPTNGPFTFTDSDATNRSRFYRAVKQ
jgi:hypothetical protein